MNTHWIAMSRMTKVLLLALLGLQALSPAMAFDRDEDFARRTPVSEAALDRMRGGFQSAPNAPVMSFGIERSVFINGQLVSSTVLNIPNLAQLTSNTGNPFTLIQTGGGNTSPSGTSSLPALMTVIQNSLDNQRIQNQTVINATMEVLGVTRSLALGNALTQATLDTIRR